MRNYTKYTEMRERLGNSASSIKSVLRQSDAEMAALVRRVIADEPENEHIIDDVLFGSSSRTKAYDVLERMETVGFVGNDLIRIHSILNHNTAELIDCLYDEDKLSDIRRELRQEKGLDWSSGEEEY